MKTLKYGLLAATAFGAIATVSSDASATVYALSQSSVRNLSLSIVDPTDPGADFPFGAFFDFNADTSASLIPGGSDAGTDDANSPFSVDRGIGVAVDPTHAFVQTGGVGNPGENSFVAIGPTAPGNYARADHILSDTLINVDGEGAEDPGFGGDWDGIAEASANGTTLGNGINSVNDQSWNFGTATFDNDVDVTIIFDLNVEQTAQLIGDEIVPAAATSTFSINFTFQDIGIGGPGDTAVGRTQSITANQGTPSISRTEPSIAGCSRVASPIGGGFSRYTCEFTVPAGTFLFKINASNAVTVEANTQVEVPEPATLGLLGLGLLGAGMVARRRRAA